MRYLKHNLNAKIIGAFTLTLLVATILSGVLGFLFFIYELSNSSKRETQVIGQGLKLQLDRLIALGIPLEDLMGFEEQCREVVQKYPTISFAAVATMEGKILFHSDSSLNGSYYKNPIILKALGSSKEEVVDFSDRQGKYYGAFIPVFDYFGEHRGAVILGFSKKIISQRIFFGVLNSIIAPLLIFSLSLVGILYFLKRWITNPLRLLGQATQEIGSGGIESFQEVKINSGDEMEDLAGSFNTMANELKRTTVSKEFVASIISSMMDALIVVNSRSEIQTVNQAAETMFQYSRGEMLQQPIHLLFPDESFHLFHMDEFQKAIREDGLNNFETSMLSKSGEVIPVLLSCSVITDSRGEVQYIVSTAKNITERKNAELALKRQAEKLVKNNAQLQEFVYIASHDLQEPLRKVTAFGDRLKNKCAGALDETALDYLERIQNAISRMQTLISDLLSYSQITTLAKPFTIVDLAKVAGEVLIDLETRIEQTQGRVEIGALPSLEGDPTQMRQLFQNIIGNALKFHRENVPPVVKISCQKGTSNNQPHSTGFNHQFYELRFSDNGIGIEEKYFDRIFGVFQKLHGRDQYEGTGVGLAICQRIIERHHGEIQVESVFEVGTTFIVKLPLRQDFAEE